MYPAILEFGPYAISSLWFLVALGFLVSGIMLIKLALIYKLKIAFLTEHFFQILFHGIIGARILYILLHTEEFFAEISAFTPVSLIAIWDKGLSFWGGIFGIIWALHKYTKKRGEPFVKWMDILTLSALCGMFFGNIGAFLEGINYGKETDLPWGVTFQNFNIPYTIPIHPSQLYAAFYTGILFTTLLILFLKEKIKTPGNPALYGLAGYSFFRFLEEFTMGEETYIFAGLRLEQWIALVSLIGAGILLTIRYNKHRENP